MIRDVSNPPSALRRFRKLRTKRDAPTRRMSERATSPTMRAAHRRVWGGPDVESRPPAFSTSCWTRRAACTAGMRPDRTVVSIASPIVNDRTLTSIGNCSARSWLKRSRPQDPIARPTGTLRRGDEQTLREQLAHDAGPRGAECHARRDFTAPRRCARQRQIGDVRAGNQQHETDCTHDHQDQRAGSCRHADSEPLDRDAPAFVLAGMQPFELAGNGSQSCAGHLQRDPVAQPGIDREVALVPPLVGRRRREREPHPRQSQGTSHADVRELRRHDPHDDAGHAVHHDGTSDQRLVAAIALLPDGMTQHHDWRRAGPILVRPETAALGRPQRPEPGTDSTKPVRRRSVRVRRRQPRTRWHGAARPSPQVRRSALSSR